MHVVLLVAEQKEVRVGAVGNSGVSAEDAALCGLKMLCCEICS